MNLHRVAALIGKELRELLRDRVTLGLAIVMPLVMLFLFGYAVTLDVKEITLAVYDEDNTPASRGLVDRFTATPYFHLTQQLTSLRDVDFVLQRSEARLVIVIPPRFQAGLVRREAPSVQILVDGTFAMTAALSAGYAQAIVASYPSPAVPAISLDTRVWYNPSLRSANFVVPGLFAVILMAFPPLLTALAIVREKESGTIQQIYVSPVTSAEFIAAKLIPYALLALFEMTMVVLVGTLWFGIPFHGSPLLLLTTSLIYVLTTVSVGLLVSAVTRTQLVAMMVALLATLMPSFLFSGFMFPVFTMPLSMQLYSHLVPASYFTQVSRGIVLKGLGLSVLWPNLAALAAYTAAIFAFSAWRLRQKVAS